MYRIGSGPKTEPIEEPGKQEGLTEAQINTLLNELVRTGIGVRSICTNYKVGQLSRLNMEQFKDAMNQLREKPDKPQKKEPDPETIPPDDDCGLPWN